ETSRGTRLDASPSRVPSVTRSAGEVSTSAWLGRSVPSVAQSTLLAKSRLTRPPSNALVAALARCIATRAPSSSWVARSLRHGDELFGAVIAVERGIVNRQLKAERLRVADKPTQELGRLLEIETARNRGIDGRHQGRVDDVDVERDPEPCLDFREPRKGEIGG